MRTARSRRCRLLCRPDKRFTRHPACFAALMPDGWNGSVHHGDGILINHLCGERDKGSSRAPLVNPRGPARKSVLRTALTSREPDCGRLDLLVPSMGLAPSEPAQALFKIAPGNFVLSRFASVRHPWRPDLVIPASVRRFQRGHNPSLQDGCQMKNCCC